MMLVPWMRKSLDEISYPTTPPYSHSLVVESKAMITML